MRDIWEIYNDAYNIVEECCGYGIIGNIADVVVNYRATRRWGCCKCRTSHGKKEYTIEISNRILNEDVPYNSVLSTMVHELLHATEGTKGHKGLWLKRANLVMRKHPELSITRCTNSEYFNLENNIERKEYKFACECERCGVILARTVQNKFVKHPEHYIHKGCGGHFRRIYQQQTSII
ncbi:MAG: hypothetical protein IJI66_14135 [Erysipelotrichaceae bacterium]|nr:hypothetical protein [Erysipelotrichaceae bacterium]